MFSPAFSHIAIPSRYLKNPVERDDYLPVPLYSIHILARRTQTDHIREENPYTQNKDIANHVSKNNKHHNSPQIFWK